MSAEDLVLVGQLLATILLILGNALFVFHEFAFVTIKPAQVKRLVQGGSAIGRLIARGAQHLDYYIAVDQLGITATSIAVGWIGQPVVARLLEQPLVLLGVLGAATVPVISAAIAFLLITGAQMVLGELMPKTVALRHPQRTASLVALPVELIARVVHPLVVVLNGSGRLAVRLLGFAPQAESHAHVLPAEELATLIEASARAGVLAADPQTLRQALRFSDIHARDLMVPRGDIVGVDASLSVEEVLGLARRAGRTRYPVYEETVDNIVGLLNIKDLVQIQPDGQVGLATNWRRLVRPIPTLPETAEVEQLLTRLSQEKQHMALLIDEFGGTAGIVTVADVVEQLLGEAEDIRPLREGQFVLQGEASVAAVEAALGIALGPGERDYDTIGGLLMARLGRIPVVGDRVDVDGHELAVSAMRGRRVVQVILRVAPESAEDPGAESQEMG